MNGALSPTSITRQGPASVAIAWSDGSQLLYTASVLRSKCPCATCREKHGAQTPAEKPRTLPVLALAEAQPLTIEHMRPVGNYAYNIAFSDGHDSGIYTFELLRELGQ
ncbi:MAG: DUF971 domain-containing protein [Planctomycetales bacterium]|nr:DUF971 domain-containing protein [Planctomycetales bacterium]